VVYIVEKSKVLMEDTWEKDLDLRLSKRSLEFFINNNTSSNTIYNPTSFDKDEILANHRSFMTSLNIPSGKESEDLPYLY
jgi:hypothetical protein